MPPVLSRATGVAGGKIQQAAQARPAWAAPPARGPGPHRLPLPPPPAALQAMAQDERDVDAEFAELDWVSWGVLQRHPCLCGLIPCAALPSARLVLPEGPEGKAGGR